MASVNLAQLHHMTVTGLMTKNEVVIKPGLNPEAYQTTCTHLKDAVEAGFDSCVILDNAVYATKKINP